MPYAYWSVRMWMLALTIFAFIIWMVTGFNLEEGDVPALGIQWSTFGTFTLFFYLLTINLQLGGLESFKQLRSEVRYDLGFLFHPLSRTRSQYRTNGVVDPLRGFTVALLVCVSCLFLFESIWVPLYDYFQFGSVMWPVYSASTSYFTVFDRNTIFFLLPLIAGLLVLPSVIDGKAPDLFHRYELKFRLDRYWVLILLCTAAVWGLWIYFPQQPFDVASLTTAQVSGSSRSRSLLRDATSSPPRASSPRHLHLLSVLGRGTALPAQRNLRVLQPRQLVAPCERGHEGPNIFIRLLSADG